jgi:hypothetical protein
MGVSLWDLGWSLISGLNYPPTSALRVPGTAMCAFKLKLQHWFLLVSSLVAFPLVV